MVFQWTEGQGINDVDFTSIIIHKVPYHTSHRTLRKFIGRATYHIQRDPRINFYLKLVRDYAGKELHCRLLFSRGSHVRAWFDHYGGRQTRNPLVLGGSRLMFSSSKEPVDRYQLRAISHADRNEVDSDYDEDGELEDVAQPVLSIRRVECGGFDDKTQFCVGWSCNASSAKSLVSFDIDETRLRIRVEKKVIDAQLHQLAQIYTNKSQTKIYFAFKHPPRFLHDDVRGLDEDKLSSGSWRDSQACDYGRPEDRFVRLSAFDDQHRQCAPYAVVYRVEVCDPRRVENFFLNTKQRLRETLGRIKESSDFSGYAFDVKKMNGGLEKLAYRLAFQVQALVTPHKLLPKDVIELQPDFKALETSLGESRAADVVRNLRTHGLDRGPHVRAKGHAVFTIPLVRQELHAAMQRTATSAPAQLERRWYHNIHTVNLTPSMGLRLEGPHADEGNRILRQYPGQEDNFVRLRITDEDASALRVGKEGRKIDTEAMFDVVYGSVFKKAGITVGGRRFYFLAYGNSGLRECICWFVRKFKVGNERVTAETIRRSIGDLSNIRVPARYAARMGQAFSSSSIVVELPASCVSVEEDYSTPDKRYDFTDGIGMVSTSVMSRVNELVQGANPNSAPLSAFQIRLGGAKGMVAVNPKLVGDQVVLRKSMVKFQADPSDTVKLEVSGYWIRPLPFFLNRQVITLLETLGVPSEKFVQLQKTAIDALKKATTESASAVSLQKHNSVGRAANMATLVKMLGAHEINAITDIPFLHDVNMSLVNYALRRIKYSSRFAVDNCVTLVGVVDEVGILKNHQIVACLRYPGEKPRYLEGWCLIGRSPMLAPGDLQEAYLVKPPEGHPLRALENVVIFPRKGDRPLPSKLSGGDLDGDLYNIIQHPDLLEHRHVYSPAEYARPRLRQLERECTVDDMVDFYLSYMKLEKLGITASLHLQHADQRANGAADPDCVKLAEMHSIAVDFAKTGLAPDMRDCPRGPAQKPDFMQKEYRLEDLRSNSARVKQHPRTHEQFYRSNKALGIMFRDVDVYADASEWDSSSRTYNGGTLAGGEYVWSSRLWQLLETKGRHQGWQGEAKAMQALLKIYYQRLHTIAEEHCPEDQMERLTEEEVFMGHVFCRSPYGTRMSVFDISKRLQDDFEEHCVDMRLKVLFGRLPDDQAGRAVLNPIRHWLVRDLSFDVSNPAVKRAFNAVVAGQTPMKRDALLVAWQTHLRKAIKRGIAWTHVAFDEADKGRSGPWIVIPSVLLAHQLLDILEDGAEELST